MIIRKEEKTQQEKKISINGTVRDAQQEPLPGVNVLVKGTTIGTTTDIDGNYFISVPDKNAVIRGNTKSKTNNPYNIDIQ